MLVLNNISFEFGSRYLYRDTSWHIKPFEKIGLIGANGTGKSTLLRVIVGEYQVTGGNITRRKDLSIGFLNQDLLSYQTSDSILKVAMEAFERANQLHDQIEEIIAKLEDDHSEDTLHKLHELQSEYESLDGYNLQYKAEEILEGLGFGTEDLVRPLREFSGGWRMRVMLAKILLQKPDLLLLDEPTNHLDLPSIKWIEQYLSNYQGTVIIVSHDRYFLDRVVTKIAEVSNEKINLYSGNYSFYLEEKVLREEMQRSQFKNQEKYIKEQEKLIDRFRAKASKAKMAQSRIKALEKMERIEDVQETNTQIKIRFNFVQQPGKTIYELKVARKQYPALHIFENTQASLLRGDKIALIGANGKGKSTLLRMIAGQEPFEGERIPGHNVQQAFFAQHQMEALNLNNSMLEELQHFAPDQADTTLRTLLGAFLFTGDDVFKKIKVLSGGEKSRVALAKTILTKANFLILDEPTNHLDIQSVNMLIQVLQQFEGSFVVVSHDRYFLSQVANKIWYIEDKAIKEYPGTYDEYDEWYENQKKAVAGKEKARTASPAAEREASRPAQPTAEDNARKKEYKKLTAAFGALEDKIAKLNQEKASLEKQLESEEVFSNPQKLTSLTDRYSALQAELDKSTEEWETVFAQITELDAQ
jgi:ATP-binding cassette, subfamily F, member 3